jgi:hypothetical protein
MISYGSLGSLRGRTLRAASRVPAFTGTGASLLTCSGAPALKADRTFQNLLAPGISI